MLIKPGSALLAPMAGYTDAALRYLCVEQGAALTYTEMVSAMGLRYGSEKTKSLISFAENENRLGVQLFAAQPDALADSICCIQDAYGERIAVFDINMGCPAPKITGGGQGCALMTDMPRAARLIEAAVKVSRLPVTVKFRKGWDDASVNAVEFARMAEQSGAAAVTVHGRTRAVLQRPQRLIHHQAGQGSCQHPRHRQRRHIPCRRRRQHAQGHRLRRGDGRTRALGNPFIFREINHL